MVLWNIWYDKNQIFHKGIVKASRIFVNFVDNYIVEFLRARLKEDGSVQ